MRRRILSALLSIIMCITILPMMAFAAGSNTSAKAYAVLDEDNTLTIGCWDTKPKGAYEIPRNIYNYENIPWYEVRDRIKNVKFKASIKNYEPTSLNYWFYDCDKLLTVKNANYLDTSAVKDMSNMFFGCSKLTTLDVSSWDTSSVTNMSFLFAYCEKLASLDVSKWDTSSVTDMDSMFQSCCLLEVIDVSSWDTSSVTRMGDMFYNCSSVTALDVSSWDTSSVNEMCGMFGYCQGLTTINLCGWDFSSVVFDSDKRILGITGMFFVSSNLKTIYVDKDCVFTDSVKENSYNVFYGCTSLVGGSGTVFIDKYNNQEIDVRFAHIDGGSSNPGYFTLRYQMSFGIGKGATGKAPESISVTQGDQITLPSSSFFSKSGYKFAGWSDGTKTYKAGETFVVGTEAVNFTAVWEKCSHEHTEVKDAKAATLTAEGYTGDTYCTDCGAKVADGKAIPTLAPEPTPGGNGGSGGGNGGSGNGNGGSVNGGSGNGSGVVIPTPTTPPPQKPTGNANKSAGEFVERCYNVCLGRSSDEAGFQYWLDMLNSGNSCGAEVGYGFVFSAEYMMKNTSNEQFVNDMYSMFFGREADAEGFNSWVEQLNNGVSRLQVYAGFASSPEFSNLCGEYGIIGVSILNDDAINAAGDVGKFVGRLYKICLSRYPDYCGFTAWTKGLQEGSKTGSTCAYGFIFSGEFMSKGLSNEEFVVYMYKVFFDREADEAGYNLWLSVLNNGGCYEEVFNGFTGSPEFAALCASYGINA